MAEEGVDERAVAPYSMPGTVLGAPRGFEAAALGDTWAAVADCGSFSISVVGPGPPPERLDLAG